MSYFIGTDTGGTFTDCVAVGDDGRLAYAKSLTTRQDPSEGVMRGISLLASDLGLEVEELLADAERVGHGSTVGTNLVVEQKGARVLLLATAGHGDALFLMRGGHARVVGIPRELVYSLHGTSLPRPLVSRQHVIEVHERIDRHGDVVAPLDEARVRADLAALLVSEEFDGVAVSLLWSFRNPSHERRLAEIVHELAPELFVSLSHEVAPRTGEYERTAATVVNALVGPASTAYLARLADSLEVAGLRGPLLTMQCNGGVVPRASAAKMPIQLIDSGPAGGLKGAATLARSQGHELVIATDMGGTSFDVGLVIGGEPVIADEKVLARHTFTLPNLDVLSIACGGGSIARFDPASRSIKVGPLSAGSEPGPACYGRGGTDATVTDADVVLGLLRPDSFLDGRMPLDVEASRRAVGELAQQIGASLEETAAGILKINNSAAAALIRQRTLEEGYDPRDFVLYAYGGAGPVHAFGFGAELGVQEVVIPLGNGASTLSAFGIASSNIVQYVDFECSLLAPLSADALAEAVATAEERAAKVVADHGLPKDDVIVERFALMRYAEQFMQSLAVPLPDGEVDQTTVEYVAAEFDRSYTRLYGEAARAVFQAVEIFDIQIRVSLPLPFAAIADPPSAGVSMRPVEQRPVFWPDEARWIDTAVHDGRGLERDHLIEGPAVVELPHTTVAVAPGQHLRQTTAGSLILTTRPQETR